MRRRAMARSTEKELEAQRSRVEQHERHEAAPAQERAAHASFVDAMLKDKALWRTLGIELA